MKNTIIAVAVMAVVSLSSGCQNAKTRVGEGAVIGGLLGAAAGGIIGHQGHHGAEGAAIGAAAGGVVGAIVGSHIEKQPGQVAQPSPLPAGGNPYQLTLQQVIDMSAQGVNPDVIIDKIRLTNSRFTLSPADISILQEKGVSQKVIDEMRAG